MRDCFNFKFVITINFIGTDKSVSIINLSIMRDYSKTIIEFVIAINFMPILHAHV